MDWEEQKENASQGLLCVTEGGDSRAPEGKIQQVVSEPLHPA